MSHILEELSIFFNSVADLVNIEESHISVNGS